MFFAVHHFCCILQQVCTWRINRWIGHIKSAEYKNQYSACNTFIDIALCQFWKYLIIDEQSRCAIVQTIADCCCLIIPAS